MHPYHLHPSAHHAGDVGPRAIFAAWRRLKLALSLVIAALSFFLGGPAVRAPCCPDRIVLTMPLALTTTTCDFEGWSGVFTGLLQAVTPTRARRGSGPRLPEPRPIH